MKARIDRAWVGFMMMLAASEVATHEISWDPRRYSFVGLDSGCCSKLDQPLALDESSMPLLASVCDGFSVQILYQPRIRRH